MQTDNNLKIEMLSTGDEVLYGQIIDTNAAWLSDFLFQHGFVITSRMTAGDDLDQLVALLHARSEENDLLIVNGGLGPTSDDLSALAAATAKQEALVLNDAWCKTMEHYFSSRGRTMPPSNLKQAMLPESAEMIDNPVGTACGFSIELNGCLIFFTPGVPSEFKVMMQQAILPRMQHRYPAVSAPLCYRLTTMGRSESDLATALESTLTLPDTLSLGYRSAMPIIELKLTGPASERATMDTLWAQIKCEVAENILYENTLGLPALLCELLNERGLTLSIIEGYTAGLLSYSLYQQQRKMAISPLATSQVSPLSTQALLTQAKHQLSSTPSDVVLALGEFNHDSPIIELLIVTHKEDCVFRFNYTGRIYGHATMQEIIVAVALDSLRRYLLNQPVGRKNLWLEPMTA